MTYRILAQLNNALISVTECLLSIFGCIRYHAGFFIGMAISNHLQVLFSRQKARRRHALQTTNMISLILGYTSQSFGTILP